MLHVVAVPNRIKELLEKYEDLIRETNMLPPTNLETRSSNSQYPAPTGLHCHRTKIEKFVHDMLAFMEEDIICLKAQTYKLKSLVAQANDKLSPRFYGPFKVLEKIGPVLTSCNSLTQHSYILFFMYLSREEIHLLVFLIRNQMVKKILGIMHREHGYKEEKKNGEVLKLLDARIIYPSLIASELSLSSVYPRKREPQ
ncbi:hypothetical protein CR513_33555, partial [Mucuna pruriens]